MSSQIIFFDASGDTTIRWDEKSDFDMKLAIEALMKKGHSFFVAEFHNNGSVVTEQQIKTIDEITQRSILVKDETLNALYENGSLKVVSGFWGKAMNMLRRIKSADEVIDLARAEPQRERTRYVTVFQPAVGG